MDQVSAFYAITHPLTQLLSEGLNRLKGSGFALLEFNCRFAQRLVTQRV